MKYHNLSILKELRQAESAVYYLVVNSGHQDLPRKCLSYTIVFGVEDARWAWHVLDVADTLIKLCWGINSMALDLAYSERSMSNGSRL
jgi:hypothetical protein